MTPPPNSGSDAWGLANELFHRALEVEPELRDAFLVSECGSNTALLGQLRAMIGAHGRAGCLEAPADFVTEPATRPSYAAAGHQIGHYRIERILGEGGMGVVYLALDMSLGRLVTVKAVSPDYTHDVSRRERLRREARAAAALSHPNIATVFDFEEQDGDCFIVGEYVEGETLRQEIGRGPANVARVIETAAAIASALVAAHDRGIVHRDLKPENIMRTPSGQIKILDFGLARLGDSRSSEPSITTDGSVLGTPAYMAPEQFRGLAVDGRTDLFALGILLHEMATGIHPFRAGSAASTIVRILEDEPPPLGPASADRPDGAGPSMRAALDAVIRTCLRKVPADRYSSAGELLAALDRARGGRSGPTPLATEAPAPARWWKVHQMATCISYAALMVPMWLARTSIGGKTGQLLFLTTLGAIVASAVLRLHLWFTATSIPSEWPRQYRQATPWLRLSDSIAVLGFLVTGAVTPDTDEVLRLVLICAAVISGLSFALIEPATTRAAFGQKH